MENTESLILNRKRQRKPSTKVLESAAAYIDFRSLHKRRRKQADKSDTSEDSNTRENATKSTVANKGKQQKEQNLESEAHFNHRKAAVTTTQLITRIWEEYYPNSISEEINKEDNNVSTSSKRKTRGGKNKNDKKGIKRLEGKKNFPDYRWMPYSRCRKIKPGSKKETKWHEETNGKTSTGNSLYRGVFINKNLVSIRSIVLVKEPRLNHDCCICYVEYMFQGSDDRKSLHGRIMVGGFETVLGYSSDKRELFLTNDCIEFEPCDVIGTLEVKIYKAQWGHQHRKENEENNRTYREGEERKTKGMAIEYFCRSLYWPEKGAFFSLKNDLMGLGNGDCNSCNERKSNEKKEFALSSSMDSFTYMGIQYNIHNFLYLNPRHFMENQEGRNGEEYKPETYVICQLVAVQSSCPPKEAKPESVKIKVKRFFRPEDIKPRNAYPSDIQEVYYSNQIETVAVTAVEGRCEVKKKEDFEFLDFPYIHEHTFHCQLVYDLEKGSIDLLPPGFKFSTPKGGLEEKDATKKKTKKRKPLATLDLFSGCGGLSEGLEKSGASITKWAIESDKMAAEAFKLNHPNSSILVNDCNVVLRDVMMANGHADDCIPTSEASSSKLDDEIIDSFPKPGEVDFICGGPPCQGFSLLNRHNKSSTSDVQRTMILSFLSFVDYFRPKFLLIENVRNLVCFDKMKPFQLTLASLIEMGYQVRFGVLQAGLYGIAQSRKRVFIWAASPNETLPEWPDPMHAFPCPDLRIKLDLDGNSHYTAVNGTKSGAPFRCLTVRDTIGDLPALTNGDSETTMEYKDCAVSWFQKRIRGKTEVLTDHFAKKLSELNLMHCHYLKHGADWRDLPQKKVELSSGKFVDLKPQWLSRMLSKGYQSKGVLGRLDWEKNFPTAITNPQPRGKVGRWFHPEQHRMISIREYARSQGFPDWYKFTGNVNNKYQQVGNAVPPPLAYALGRKLKEAMEENS